MKKNEFHYDLESLPEVLTILKSKDRVLFPKMMLPYPIYNQDLLNLIKESEYIGTLYGEKSKIGTIARVLEVSEVGGGGGNILLQGLVRFSITKELDRKEHSFEANVIYLEDEYNKDDSEIQVMKPKILSLFNKMNKISPTIPRDIVSMINEIYDDVSMICDMIAASADTTMEERQEILEEVYLNNRMKNLLVLLNKKLHMLEVGTKIDRETRKNIEDVNKEYFLRKQRDQINKQLGEEDSDNELEEYKKKIETKNLPEEALIEANRELKRMERMHTASHEYSVVATYLDWIIDLPWNDFTEDNLDISEVRKKLDNDHYGLDKPKKRILEFLAVRQMKAESRTPILCFVGPPGTGKAQPLDAKVLTPTGFVDMKDINVGSYVVTPSGKYARVLGVFPQGFKDIYEVSFSDGSRAQCCKEHLWKVQTREDRKNNRYRITELDSILHTLLVEKDKRKNYSIDTITKVDLKSNKDIEIDPYLVGFFISDGHGKRRSISKKDNEIINFISEIVSKIGCKLSQDSKKDYRIVKINHNSADNINKDDNKSKFHLFLEKAGLIKCLAEDKFIPEEYLYSSYKTRERLLQGILDGDGHPVKDACAVEWSSASKKLSSDVIFLTQSLGGQARYSKGVSFYTYKGKKLKGKDRHRLRIVLPKYVKPFRSSKKLTIYNDNLGKKKNIKRFIKNIKFIGTKEAKCILIDHPDHLYITDNFIITHNTSLGKSIAEALGRKFYRMSLGGVRDEADIRGFRRTYVGSMPGKIIQSIKRAGSNNPLIMLDEVDKLCSDHRGDPSSALLEALDPEQNNTFNDHYINVPFDLSKVMFITTANTLETIQPALKDRMETIELHGYSQYEKLKIAKEFLISKQKIEHGLSEKQVFFEEEALDEIINAYTRESGVRNLERGIADVCRGVVTDIVEGEVKVSRINRDKVRSYLGVPKYKTSFDIEITKSGVSRVLYVSTLGGRIDMVETVKFVKEGKMPKIIISGSLGDVMKESAKVALSWIKDNLGHKAILSTNDIHIHFPSGAQPKDGPSAGISLVTALVSLLTDIKVKSNFAMTGEMTLRGKVLEIGGVKYKALAAHKAGVTDIILPRWNKKDLEDLPPDVLEDVTFHFVDDMKEVLELVF